MKNSKNTIKFLLLMLALTAFFSLFSAVSVFAEPDETYAIESYVATEAEVTEETDTDTTYTEAIGETEEYTEAEEYTEQTDTETQPSTTGTAETEANEEKTEPTYRAPLPEIEDTEIVPPTVVGAVEDREEPSLFWGFVSWILIGVGAAVIFAVVLSTKAKAYRGGRDRYSTTDKISGKKKLLSQDYYDKRKRR